MNRLSIAIGMCLSMAIAGCTSTNFISSKKADDVGTLDLAGKKAIALVIHSDEANRIKAENALAKELTKRGMNGIAANTVIATADNGNKEKVKKAIKDSGAEGLVVVRVVGIEDTSRYVPGFNDAYYGSMMSYYDQGYATAYSPGYMQTYTTFTIETLCYRVSDEKLVWSGTSETFSPNSIKSFAKELVSEAGKVMKKQGLIAK
jgi:hypothetical protein